MLSALYHNILYQPLFNILVFFYDIIPVKDVGWSIILLTVVIRLLLFPLSKSSIESQKKLQDIKPELDALKEKHKDDKEAFGKATMALYKEKKINPASSCLPLLIQLPILFAVYQVLRVGLSNGSFDLLYSFVSHPGVINSLFLGFINLAEPNIVLAILAGLGQYFQSKMIIKTQPEKNNKASGKADLAGAMSKQMLYFMPIFTVFIGMSLPSGLALYWLVSILLTILQQYLVLRKTKVTQV
ncbi:MAG: YidC/Oxa1 family membrane protein insertase [Candidatus Komeilibacteria bacterium]